MPGSGHVTAGDFIINEQGQENRALGPSNWASSVYPGCNLSMAVVFSALKLSLLRCPRPGCGLLPSGGVEDGSFITWYAFHIMPCPSLTACSNKCGLSYRLNRNNDLPPKALTEQRLEARQRSDDVRRFGQRPVPADVAEIPGDIKGTLTNPEPELADTARDEYNFGTRPPTLSKPDVAERK